MNEMITARIKSVKRENENITTYEIEKNLKAKPGQFIMVWLPGIGERPMGIADNEPLTMTVAHVGEFTNKMRELKTGDYISFRGPLGKGFTLPKRNERVLLIGGGTGIAPLHFLAKEAKRNEARVKIIFGARTRSLLFYQERLERVADELVITTDDGSFGVKGNVLAAIGDIKNIDRIYTCGPERMMAAVVKMAVENSVRCEASLERYMKCGIGVCGSCMIGKYRVCADGPVFDGRLLAEEEEFGKEKRDASGKRIPL